MTTSRAVVGETRPDSTVALGHVWGIDALRAVAALCVLATHLWKGGVDFGPFARLAEGGTVGTTMFFVLSGFLLYEPFVRGSVPVRGYLVRRVFRIMPAYLVALVGISLLTGDRSFWNAPVTYGLLLQNFDLGLFQKFFAPAWTLQLEMLFYLLLPLIAVALARARADVGRPSFILCAAGIASLWTGFSVLIDFPGPTGYWLAAMFPAMFWAFVPGMVLALVAVRRPHALRQIGGRLMVVVGVVMLLVGLYADFGYGSVLTASGTVILIAAAIQSRRSGRLFVALAMAGATLSYPFYLWHYDVMYWLEARGIHGWMLAIAVVLPVGLISALSYVLVERPAMRFARRVSRRWLPAPARATTDSALAIDGAGPVTPPLPA